MGKMSTLVKYCAPIPRRFDNVFVCKLYDERSEREREKSDISVVKPFVVLGVCISVYICVSECDRACV